MKRIRRAAGAALWVGLFVWAGAPEARAEDAKAEVDLGLSVRPRAELRLNHHFNLKPEEVVYGLPDSADFVSQQSRLSATVKRGELSGKLVLQHFGVWGTFGGDQLTDPVVGVHEAWLKVERERWAVQAGRQELLYGDQRVLGPVGWNQVGRAWDAAKVSIEPREELRLDVFAGEYAEGFTERPPTFVDERLFDEDAWLVGAYGSMRAGLEPALERLDLYLLEDLRLDAKDAQGERRLRRSLMTAGGLLKGRWAVVDVTVEGAFQAGSACKTAPDAGLCVEGDNDLQAWFVDAEVGVNVEKRARVGVGFGQATGDDPRTEDKIESYDQLYPTAHLFLGLMDLIGPRSNVREVRLVGWWKPVEEVKLDARVHDFVRLRSKPGADWKSAESEHVGNELDLIVDWAPLKGLGLQAGYGLFLPDDAVSKGDAKPEGLAHWTYLQASLSL
jgi:hypothetical protein